MAAVLGMLIGVTLAKPVDRKSAAVTVTKPLEKDLAPFVPIYMGNWD